MENAGSSPTNKPGIFISYSWDKKTDGDVRNLAKFLQTSGQFEKVWIDVNDMGNDSVGEQMAENVRLADVVLICFNNHYQTRPNCKKEAKLADKYGKPILFINMEKDGPLKVESWFDAIILDNLYTNFYKITNPHEEILNSTLMKLKPKAQLAPIEQPTTQKVMSTTNVMLNAANNTTNPVTASILSAMASPHGSQKHLEGLYNAIKNGKLEKVKKLVEKDGADINARFEGDASLGTALFYACCYGQLDITNYLIEKGCDVEATSVLGWTCLMTACVTNVKDVVKMLLDKDANVNTVACNGWTPLMWAVKNGSKDIVQLLLQQKNLTTLNNKAIDTGQTALDIAEDKDFEEIEEILKAAGAESSS